MKVSACRLCLGCWGDDLLRQDKRSIRGERVKVVEEDGMMVSVLFGGGKFQGDGPFLDLVF